MDVTIKRGGFAALLLAALLLPIARRTRSRDETRGTDDRAARLDSLSDQLTRALYTAGAIELRDSATALVARSAPAYAPPRIAAEGFPTGIRFATAAAEIASLWQRIGTVDTSVNVLVLVTGTRYVYGGTVITAAHGKLWCVAGARGVVVGAARRQVVEAHLLYAAVAPCALLAEFGPPGATVAKWLAETRFVSAASVNWLLRPKDFVDPGQTPWVQWWPAPSSRQGPGAVARIFGALQLEQFALNGVPPYQYGAAGLRCITGNLPACVTSVLHPAVAQRDGIPNDLIDQMYSRPDTVRLATVHPPEPTFLSALISQQGRDKFARFWKSDRPFEAAFRDAFGTSLGAWTAAWARREWDATYPAKYSGLTIRLGTTLEPGWAAIATLWAALSVAIAAAVARRRQVQ